MLKKKCPSCAKKIERKFNYCPHCGGSFKALNEEENFGFLGRNDNSEIVQEELKLPFGFDKIVGSLVKQLEKQMNDIDFRDSSTIPRGMKIRVSTGIPQTNQVVKRTSQRVDISENVSEKEMERRMSLPRLEASSRVKRLGDRIIYEIEAPGIKSKKDVVITELASGLEIKIYSKDKCYVKFIALTVEVIRHYVKGEKLFVELKV